MRMMRSEKKSLRDITKMMQQAMKPIPISYDKHGEDAELLSRIPSEFFTKDLSSTLPDFIAEQHFSIDRLSFCFGLAMCCTDKMKREIEALFAKMNGVSVLEALSAQEDLHREYNRILPMLSPEHAKYFSLLVGCFGVVLDDNNASRQEYSLCQLLRLENEELFRLMKKKYHHGTIPFSVLYGDFLDREEELSEDEFSSNNKLILKTLSFTVFGMFFSCKMGLPQNELETSILLGAMRVQEDLKNLRSGWCGDLSARQNMVRKVFWTERNALSADDLRKLVRSELFQAFVESSLKRDDAYPLPYELTMDMFSDMVSMFESSERVPMRALVEIVDSYYADACETDEESNRGTPASDAIYHQLNQYGYLYTCFNSDSNFLSATEFGVLLIDFLCFNIEKAERAIEAFGTDAEISIKSILTPYSFFDVMQTMFLTQGLYSQYRNSNDKAASYYDIAYLSREREKESERALYEETILALQEQNRALLDKRADAIAVAESELKAELYAEIKKLRDNLKKSEAEVSSLKRKLDKSTAETSRLNSRLQEESQRAEELFNILQAPDDSGISGVTLADKLACISKYRLCLAGGHFDNIAKLKKEANVVAEFGDSGIPHATKVDVMVYFTDWMSHKIFDSAQSWCAKNNTPYIYVSKAKNYELIVSIIYDRIRRMEDQGVLICDAE